MIKDNHTLNEFMAEGIKRLIGNVMTLTLTNPKMTLYLLRMQKILSRAREKREYYEKKGIHVPVFLISSITENCNLFCNGCYARSNGICGSGESSGPMLSVTEWERIFTEAVDMGITFNILAGGEPLMRKEVIECAAKVRDMIFPIFTNGTLIDEEYMKLFAQNPNLIPVISMEGFERETDQRRGEGIYSKLLDTMRIFHQKKLIYGASVTVTSDNLRTVTSDSFIDLLRKSGCKLLFYIEYVPVEKGSDHLVLSDRDKKLLENILKHHKDHYKDILFLSFPGDEQYMGGCLAAGRGFFHINANGDAEACPFSPFSDRNLVKHRFPEVLQSPFFTRLREAELVGGEHHGGCVLFEKEEQVKKLLSS